MHLEDLERQSGVRPPELDGPPCPEELSYVWGWFCELSGARGGGFGPAPLAWGEIDAWCRLNARRLLNFEREAIGALDRKFIETNAPKKKDK